MRCPKCGYNSFEYNKNCPKCRKDLGPMRRLLGLTMPSVGSVNFFQLASQQMAFSDSGFGGPEITAEPSGYEPGYGAPSPHPQMAGAAGMDQTIYPMDAAPGYGADVYAQNGPAAPMTDLFPEEDEEDDLYEDITPIFEPAQTTAAPVLAPELAEDEIEIDISDSGNPVQPMAAMPNQYAQQQPHYAGQQQAQAMPAPYAAQQAPPAFDPYAGQQQAQAVPDPYAAQQAPPAFDPYAGQQQAQAMPDPYSQAVTPPPGAQAAMQQIKMSLSETGDLGEQPHDGVYQEPYGVASADEVFQDPYVVPGHSLSSDQPITASPDELFGDNYAAAPLEVDFSPALDAAPMEDPAAAYNVIPADVTAIEVEPEAIMVDSQAMDQFPQAPEVADFAPALDMAPEMMEAHAAGGSQLEVASGNGLVASELENFVNSPTTPPAAETETFSQAGEGLRLEAPAVQAPAAVPEVMVAEPMALDIQSPDVTLAAPRPAPIAENSGEDLSSLVDDLNLDELDNEL